MAVQNFDVVGAARAGEQYRVLRDKQIQQQQDEKLVRDLSPKIQAGDPSAYGQAAAVNPEGANAALGAGDTMARRAEGLIKMLEQADTSNPQAAQALWQQYGVPFARQFSQGTEPTANWAEAKPMLQNLKARIEMAKSQQAGPAPAGFQQADMIARAAGYVPGTPEYQHFMQVQGGVAGRAPSGGFGFEKIVGADGRERIARKNPRTGVVEVYNEATGDFSPMGSGAALNGGAPAGQGGFNVDFTDFPPEMNQQIETTLGALHGAGASDAVIQAYIDTVRSQPRAQNGAPVASVAPSGLGVSQSPEERKFAEESGQQRAQLQFLPEQERIKTEAAIAQAGGSEEAKQRSQARVELEQLLPKVQSDSRNAIALIDKALNHPGRAASTGLSSVNPLNRLPGSDAMNFRVLLDQLRGGTFLQAFQSLKGGGAITQVEGQKAEQAIARLNEAQSDDEFIVALEDFRKVAEGLPSSIQKKLIAASAGGQQGGQTARPQTEAEYNALPSGALFIDPDDGKTYRKP